MPDAIDIRSFHEPDSGTWTHLLGDREQCVAAIIDPVWVYDPVSGLVDSTFVDDVLAAAESAGYRIEWILETHAHADHLTAADLLRRRTGARIACGRGICGVQRTFAAIFNLSDLPCDGRQFDRLHLDAAIFTKIHEAQPAVGSDILVLHANRLAQDIDLDFTCLFGQDGLIPGRAQMVVHGVEQADRDRAG